ncbi:VOC family protein [Intrasporangium sp.]|uniref:VOC family protein n=1 Tax=Intrasporangium sp. TaxID=1925024 RepID=UPI0032219509
MALHWYSVVLDSYDVRAQARWWAETLDWAIVYESADEAGIAPRWVDAEARVPAQDWDRLPQGLVFVTVPEDKQVKNRLHLELAPHPSQDRDAHIAELIARGARRVDVGQSPQASWTVLADPEGNEFCVLSARDR